MGATQGNIGRGTLVQVLIASVWTTILEVFDAEPPDPKVESLEFTNYNSPNFTKEFKYGWLDPNEAAFKATLIDSQYAAIFAMVQTNQNWQMVLPPTGAETHSGTVIQFPGFLTSLKRAIPINGRMTYDVKIKVSGAITETQGS